MRVLLSTYGSRGDVEPLVALAVTTGVTSLSAAGLPRRAAGLIAGRFDAVTAAAEGCDALVATGVMPAAAGAWSVAKPLLDTVSSERPPVPA